MADCRAAGGKACADGRADGGPGQKTSLVLSAALEPRVRALPQLLRLGVEAAGRSSAAGRLQDCHGCKGVI